MLVYLTEFLLLQVSSYFERVCIVYKINCYNHFFSFKGNYKFQENAYLFNINNNEYLVLVSFSKESSFITLNQWSFIFLWDCRTHSLFPFFSYLLNHSCYLCYIEMTCKCKMWKIFSYSFPENALFKGKANIEEDTFKFNEWTLNLNWTIPSILYGTGVIGNAKSSYSIHQANRIIKIVTLL